MAGLWAPVLLYMAVIFVASAQPDVSIPDGLTDKSSHMLGYIPLGILLVRALAGGLPAQVTWRMASMAIVIAFAYAVTDEIHQMFVPGRSAEAYDLVADAIGASIGAGACWLWGIISPSWPLKT
jgi:VanZ family protein